MNDEALETDVVVVGGGGAGMAAALEASAAGARVAVIEIADQPGGTSAISGGGCCIVGTPLQRAQGIEDSPDLAFDDWIRCGQGAADEAWARFYIEHSLYDLYFWAEKLGVKWLELNHMEGNSVPRWHRPADNGRGITNALLAGLRAQPQVRMLAGCGVERLVTEAGRVCGVHAVDRSTGESRQVRGHAVVVSTGGFNSNLDMVLEQRPELKPFKVMEGSGRYATGSGHRLLREHGACFTHMENISFYVYATPDYRHAEARRGLVFRGTPGYVWVNQQGRRFHDESRNGAPSATPALLKQNPPHAWAVLDSGMIAGMQVADPYYRDGDKIRRDRIAELLENSPFIRRSPTISGLAEAIGVETDALVSEIERYNRAFDDGLERESAFGKPLKGCKKFDTPPYFGMQLFPLARKNLGGVKTDLQCRVLDKHLDAIPGLYAAGELAGMAGGHINGRAGLEGTMLGPSLFSGRVAGAWAAKEAGFGEGFKGKANRG